MDIIIESVKKIEALLEHSGCTDAGVLLDVDPGVVVCQFERGASMSASFGGKSAVFTTYDPVRACTKVSFMFGAPLDTSPARSAACAIINVMLGFLCMSRVLHACPESCHVSCRDQILKEIAAKKLFCIGSMGTVEPELCNYVLDNPSNADIILINGEGILTGGTGEIIANNKDSKRIICVGPSTAGIARLHEIEHWCPFGRS